MMTNHITNTSLSYQIDLPSLWNFPACWLSLCEEVVEDLDMACGHGNLLTLGCCTSWSKVGQATHQNTDGVYPLCVPTVGGSLLCIGIPSVTLILLLHFSS